MILEPEDIMRKGDVIIFDDNSQDTICDSMVGFEVGVFLRKGIKEIVRYPDQCYGANK